MADGDQRAILGHDMIPMISKCKYIVNEAKIEGLYNYPICNIAARHIPEDDSRVFQCKSCSIITYSVCKKNTHWGILAILSLASEEYQRMYFLRNTTRRITYNSCTDLETRGLAR